MATAPAAMMPMATTTQAPAPAPATQPDPAMLNEWYSNYLRSTPQTQQATATTWTPTADATAAGQFTKLTTPGSAAQPLMDMATTQAQQQANARGMLNSSMAVGEGQKAAYSAALPLAMQDASTFARAQSEGAAAQNQTSMFNAGQYNTALGQQNNAGAQGFFNQQRITADQQAQQAQFQQQDKTQATQIAADTAAQTRQLTAQEQAQQRDIAAAAQRQAEQIKADAAAQNRQLTAAEQQQIRDLEAQAARQQAAFGQENAMLKATQAFTTTRDAALFQQELQRINAQADANIRQFDAQNGTKLYDSYREASQQTYDAYISAVQQIQTSDMDASVKQAQIANLQQMFVTRQSFLNTMYSEAPQWVDEWSTFDMSFGAPTPPAPSPAPRPPAPSPAPTPRPPTPSPSPAPRQP